MRAMPRKRASVPRVTTRDGRPPRATIRPFRRPPKAPTTRTTAIPTHNGTPAAQRKPRMALERPAIDSTERSISPRTMIRVIGIAMIATSISAAMRLEKLPAVRKNGDRVVPRTMRPMRARTSRVSQRASRLIQRRWSRAGAAVMLIGRAVPRSPAGAAAG
jgi:hypothetical protein